MEALEVVVRHHDIKAVVVMANVGNPLGSIMPDERKQKLVEMTECAGIPLIEDDIYGDLPFEDYLRMARLLVGMGITKVRLTGGEPLLHPRLASFVEKQHFGGLGAGGASIANVQDGDQWTCTITNTRRTSTLSVRKVLSPAGDAGKFNLLIDGAAPDAGSINVGNGGSTGATTVNTGSHTFGESAGTATSLSDYATRWACGDGVNATSGTGTRREPKIDSSATRRPSQPRRSIQSRNAYT